jgi:hypothetical protein
MCKCLLPWLRKQMTLAHRAAHFYFLPKRCTRQHDVPAGLFRIVPCPGRLAARTQYLVRGASTGTRATWDRRADSTGKVNPYTGDAQGMLVSCTCAACRKPPRLDPPANVFRIPFSPPCREGRYLSAWHSPARADQQYCSSADSRLRL